MDKDLIIRKAQYVDGGVYLDLLHRTEGPYATITTCLPGITSDKIIALNHDLEDFDSELAKELMKKLAERKVGEQQVGFVNFGLYELKEGILDTIEDVCEW